MEVSQAINVLVDILSAESEGAGYKACLDFFAQASGDSQAHGEYQKLIGAHFRKMRAARHGIRVLLKN